MKLLLTNDDGIDAPGIQTLASVLRREHEVW
ncbi:MAG: 5'/3'-nucleotidase SurE, partial [Treponema sp.]|nr:5'/3'-nucleotidase SurE [Treponema sp.]